MKMKKIVTWLIIFAFMFNMMQIPQYADDSEITVDISDNPGSDNPGMEIIQKLFPGTFDMNNISDITIRYSSDINKQIGKFDHAKDAGVLDFNTGIALSSGDLRRDLIASGSNYPNTNGNIVTGKYSGGKEIIDNYPVYDYASIEFTLNADSDGHMFLKYAFASEEYVKYSNSQFNDKFGIIVNGINYAKVPGTDDIIAINTVNQVHNTEFFIQNIEANGIEDAGLKFPMNGLTKTFVSKIDLQEGANRVKIIIGDLGDRSFDSVLFIKANSIELKDPEPGTLSIAKVNNNIVVTRKDGEDGTIGFTIEEKDVEGNITETSYTMDDGEKIKEILIADSDEDDPTKISNDTLVVTITNPKMGAIIDNANKEVKVKIIPPVLTTIKNDDGTFDIQIVGTIDAEKKLYKYNDETSTYDEIQPLILNSGKYKDAQPGKYKAIQIKDGLKSNDSNILIIKKPPIIEGNFDSVVIDVNDAGFTEPEATAKDGSGNDITDAVVKKVNDIKGATVNKALPGIYTIEWSVSHSGYTVLKTKIVTVKPAPPTLISSDYKDSELIIEGTPNAIVKITDEAGDVIATLTLDGNGDGKLLDPPNGTFKATQTVNGVESAATNGEEINRIYTSPSISLKGNNAVDMTYLEVYTEEGATANDDEEDNILENMENGVNKVLTKAITIDNPMIDGNGQAISINPKPLGEDGVPDPEITFTPFVGKYVITYAVKDTDEMEGKAERLVRVKPPVPTAIIPNVDGKGNVGSKIEVDALSSASVFLYNENGEAINIVNGVVNTIQDPDLYQDGKHAKLKMQAGSSISDTVKGYFEGLPNGNYKLLQRLYGLNSELTAVVTVEAPNNLPVITLKGLPTEIIVKGNAFNDPGIIVTDAEDDQDLTDDKKTTIHDPVSTVNNNKVGEYTVTYSATDSDNNTTTIIRKVVVKPPNTFIIVGDYVNGSFTANSNGNDIKVVAKNKDGDIIPLEANAEIQLVKGTGPNGALYAKKAKGSEDFVIFENVIKSVGEEKYAAFQTVSDIQSNKSNKEKILKTNHAPVITGDYKALTFVKGDSAEINTTNITATDAEDDAASLPLTIQVYDSNKQVPTSSKNIDTTVVGTQKFYYGVVDSDGNKVFKLREVLIRPKAPTLTVNESPALNITKAPTITVSDVISGAIVELFKKEGDSYVLFATKTVPDDANEVNFINLDTGTYKARQRYQFLDSDDSEEKLFENIIYLRAKLVNEQDEVLKDIEFTVENQKVRTDDEGIVLFAVDTVNKGYDMTFINNNVSYTALGRSSEDITAWSVDRVIVGSLFDHNNNPVAFDKDKLDIKLKKKVGAEYQLTKTAKITYKNGEYRLNKLAENTEYLIEAKYKVGDAFLSLSKITLTPFDEGSIKVVNKDLKYGIVKDESGNLLSGVKVSLYYPKRDKNGNNVPDYDNRVELEHINQILNQNINGSLTDSNGRYGYAAYDNTDYMVVYEKSGYETLIKEVNNVNGELLSENVIMKGLAVNNTGSSSEEAFVNINEAVEKDEEIVDIISDDNAIDEISDNGGISYVTDNKQKDDSIVLEPEKGDVFLNPETGNVLYIPSKNGKGEDEFTIETRDKNGEKVKVTRNIDIGDNSSNDVDNNTLKIEINADKKTGFVGDEFTFDIDLKNNMEEDIDSASIAVKIPEGFIAGDDLEYELNGDYIIIPVEKMPSKGVRRISFTLKAGKGAEKAKEISALVDLNNGSRLSPMNASSIKLSIYEVGKRYSVKPYVKGRPDGKFYSKEPVTRAEIAAMLTRCLSNDEVAHRTDKKIDFTDVSKDAWYSKYVENAVSYGLFNGFKDGSFKPDKYITRGELARTIGNYFMITVSEKNPIIENFSDINGHWAEDEINSLDRYGIINGFGDGSFRPDETMTREQAVKMINGMLFRETIVVETSSFSDLDLDHWSSADIEGAYRGYEFEMDKNGDFEIFHEK